MIRFDREVKERELILAMLDMFQDVVLGVIQTFIRLFLTDYRHIKCHAEGNYFDDGQSSDLIKQVL